MTARPLESYLSGVGGVEAAVPGRVAAWLERHAGLNALRIAHRGTDPEIDNVLGALRLAALSWRASALGSGPRNLADAEPLSGWMSTSDVAGELYLSTRAVVLAIARGRLNAEQVDGRWRITREDFEQYRAARRAS